MKATMRHGRGSAKHNEHDPETKNARWDKTKSGDNYVITCMDDEDTKTYYSETDAELMFYEKTFGKTLEKQNEKYIKKQGKNTDRVKSMEQWMQAERHRPVETILQVGDKDNHPTPEELYDMVVDYGNWMEDRFEGHYSLISATCHVDEATPHFHLRGVWHYTDENGLEQTGIKETMKRMGIPLPDPTQPEGRNNYRKTVVDTECREKWYDIVESYGYTIDRTPQKRGFGFIPAPGYAAYAQAMEEVNDMAAEAHQRLENALERERDIEVREKELKALETALNEREETMRKKEMELTSRAKLESDVKHLSEDYEKLKEHPLYRNEKAKAFIDKRVEITKAITTANSMYSGSGEEREKE